MKTRHVLLRPYESSMRHMSREEMKLVDTISMESFKVAGSALMELAGISVAAAVEAFLKGPVEGKRIAVLCGTGNNGGDGLAAARFLSNWKADVKAYLIGRSRSMADPDAAGALHAAERIGIPIGDVQTLAQAGRAVEAIREVDCVIDGIFGIGLSPIAGRVREPAATLIEALNGTAKPVVAIDIPSGLDANTGLPIGPCVKAALTVTMGLPKKGMVIAEGPGLCGRIWVAELGYPRMLLEERQGLYLHRKPPAEEKAVKAESAAKAEEEGDA